MEFATMMELLLSGLAFTVQIFLVTLVGSLPLGVLVAFGRMSRFKPIALVTRFYISVMRGTPLMLQLMVVYFGPFYLFRIPIGGGYRLWAAFIAFVINYAAYFGEIFRGGIQSMPAGQYEAAKLLGYTRPQTFRKIILPQVIKQILPSVTNEVITLVKDTSLAYTIAVTEMFSMAKEIAARETSLAAFFAAGLFYYIFNALVAAAMESAEKRLSYYK